MQREEQARSPTKSEWDSADVKAYKCIQMLVLRKARDSAVLKGLVWGEGRRDCDCLEIFRLVLLSISIPTVTARNSFRIVKAGLSEYCTASEKIISAVPPPLFRGGGKGVGGLLRLAKLTERSLKGKGDGAKRGIVRM